MDGQTTEFMEMLADMLFTILTTTKVPLKFSLLVYMEDAPENTNFITDGEASAGIVAMKTAISLIQNSKGKVLKPRMSKGLTIH